jgi:hypothetical protein
LLVLELWGSAEWGVVLLLLLHVLMPAGGVLIAAAVGSVPLEGRRCDFVAESCLELLLLLPSGVVAVLELRLWQCACRTQQADGSAGKQFSMVVCCMNKCPHQVVC